MDDPTFVLAIIPPFFAIIAEKFNPVSRTQLEEQSLQSVENLGLVAHPIDNTSEAQARYNETRRNIGRAMTSLAEGVLEISGIVPTWISIATTAVAVLHEFNRPLLWLILPFIITFFSAVVGFYFFGRVRYSTFALRRVGSWPCHGLTQAQCLSRALITANIFLILLCFVVWVVG